MGWRSEAWDGRCKGNRGKENVMQESRGKEDSRECSMAQRKVLEWDGGTRMGWRDYSGLERLKWDGGIRVG